MSSVAPFVQCCKMAKTWARGVLVAIKGNIETLANFINTDGVDDVQYPNNNRLHLNSIMPLKAQLKNLRSMDPTLSFKQDDIKAALVCHCKWHNSWNLSTEGIATYAETVSKR